MSADADTVIIPKIEPESPLEMFRPAEPSRGIGVRLRGFIGIQEDILDWAPEERARYTKLSAIVLNTGLMAALSLLAALHTISPYWPYLIPVTLFWGYLIVSFDGWLVASTHGRLTARLRVFVPRLMLSILIGAAIAEPMVLWVFQPAIQKEVLDDRQNQIAAYSGQLTTCNPISGQIIDTPACSGFHVNVTDAPSSLQDELNRTINERDSEQNTVTHLDNEMAALRNMTNNECTGVAGASLTGLVGIGPNCKRDRQNELRFRSDSRLDQHAQDLTTLDNQVDSLTSQLDQVKKTFGSQVTAAIAAQVRQKRADQGTIGILDELKGLSILASQNVDVNIAQWMLRLLLIAIDCLPVLTKMLGGETAYDSLVFHQLVTSKRLHQDYVGMRQRVDQDRIGRQVRTDRSSHAVDKAAQIEELAQRLLRKGSSS